MQSGRVLDILKYKFEYSYVSLLCCAYQRTPNVTQVLFNAYKNLYIRSIESSSCIVDLTNKEMANERAVLNNNQQEL